MADPTLRFDRGTLLLDGLPDDEVPPSFVWDERVRCFRAPACTYREVVAVLHRRGRPYVDEARGYGPLGRAYAGARKPRDYQARAVDRWVEAGRRGVVVLPTGAGKTFVAELCIARADRSALVVAPTLELVAQWHTALARAFGEPIGVLGGGRHEVHDLTVATYDSAWLLAERYGARFGLVVFDEVHHLPGPSYALAATSAIAPFRLGLTATLERPDGAHERLVELVGPVVDARSIRELAGDYLAPYRTEVVDVILDPAERAAYDAALAEYRGFREARRLPSGRDGFRAFLREASRSAEGRSAYRAFRESRRILHRTPRKLELLGDLLAEHRGSRVLVFTNDNTSAYEVSRTFLVPAITHRTPPRERTATLRAFSSGELPVVATSRVLNEGVDVPEAEVAVVLSGTGTVREHVQRLGRILRPSAGKQAVLYELVVAGTIEEATSARRREHDAYQG